MERLETFIRDAFDTEMKTATLAGLARTYAVLLEQNPDSKTTERVAVELTRRMNAWLVEKYPHRFALDSDGHSVRIENGT